jgi:RND family efflux transporter MFP subunit
MTTSPPDLSSLRIERNPPAQRPGGPPPRALWLVLGVLLVAGAAAAFLLVPRPPRVELALVESTGGGSVSGAGITANGYVVARTKASVSAKIPGRLEYLGVSEGSRVERGDVVARIEGADYAARLAAAQATLAQNQAQLVQARRELRRAQALRGDNLISEVELENAQTRVEVLEAQVKASRAEVELASVNLENTRVRAPFDGTVLRKDAEVGEIVAPSSAGGGLTRTAIVTMADLATLEVEVDVNEAYIAQIRNGQEAAITLDAYPDTSFRGRVRQVVPTADRQKATVQVKVSILDRDPRILPEMGAKVTFLREGGEVAATTAARRVLVPAAAVVTSAAGTRVWVFAEGKVSARAVDVGPERDGKLEIRRGLDGGESVVVSPPAGLKDGARVNTAN